MGTIVIINGLSNCGKDSFCEFCGDIAPIHNISTVDKIRKACKLLGDLDLKNNIKDRNFMGEMKQLSIKYKNHPQEYIHERYLSIKNSSEEVLETDDFTIFIHSREPIEIDFFKQKYSIDNKCVTVLLTSNRIIQTEENIPDKEVLNYKYDYIIENNGTLDDLRHSAIKFMKEITNAKDRNHKTRM